MHLYCCRKADENTSTLPNQQVPVPHWDFSGSGWELLGNINLLGLGSALPLLHLSASLSSYLPLSATIKLSKIFHSTFLNLSQSRSRQETEWVNVPEKLETAVVSSHTSTGWSTDISHGNVKTFTTELVRTSVTVVEYYKCKSQSASVEDNSNGNEIVSY